VGIGVGAGEVGKVLSGFLSGEGEVDFRCIFIAMAACVHGESLQLRLDIESSTER
jgi:hypothetical protein